MSKWKVYAKKADFKAIGSKYGIDQVVARVIRNRDICTEEEFDMYLRTSLDSLYNPELLKDAVKAVEIICDKIKSNKKIRIIGDYDIDGVCATTILYKAFKAAGADVDYAVPHRITDGYGINDKLIDKAIEEKVDTIVTCDNGIAAINQIKYAKEQGITVVVTDHHDVLYEEKDGVKEFILPNADAVVNPKQPDCSYPFKKLCGGAVAYKLVCLLYDRLGLDREDLDEYLQLAAIATIGDVMDLTDENRIIVKYGLKMLATTKNEGIRALIEACNLDITELVAYHIGFVVGPCLNASGRLDTAKNAVELLLETDKIKAGVKAELLKSFNEERKKMTEDETIRAIDMVETSDMRFDNVLVVYMPACHESIAGIIAGRLREYFYKPVFVITDAEDGAKGSGRSIEGYNMHEQLIKCEHLLTKFGGHPMAAGLSLAKENIDRLRYELNQNQTLTEDQLEPVIWIDVPMPVDYVTFSLIEQLSVLEPFGKGNEKPIFADKNLMVRNANVIGKNANVLKLSLQTQAGALVEAVKFKFDGINMPKRGQRISIVYYPNINEYNGKRTIQFIINEMKIEK